MGRITRSNSTRGIGTSTIHWTLQNDSFIVRVSCTKSSFILRHLAEDVFPEPVSRSYLSSQQWGNFQPRDRHYCESVSSITYIRRIFGFTYIYISLQNRHRIAWTCSLSFSMKAQDGNQSIVYRVFQNIDRKYLRFARNRLETPYCV